jgi:hypothetical protein
MPTYLEKLNPEQRAAVESRSRTRPGFSKGAKMNDSMANADKTPSSKKASILLFLLLLYAGCFILFYGLAYVFFTLTAGPDIYAPVASCVTPAPGSRVAPVCGMLIALQYKFVSPWFFGGLVVTVGTLATWWVKSKRAS